jgi:acetyl-CoA C-acetyltransferase
LQFDDVFIPVEAAWSSPFVRWRGPAADISAGDLAAQVTADALARSGVEWQLSDLVFGLTIPQKESFYGGPTLAAPLGLGHTSGPMLGQACATSVACLNWAAATQQLEGDGARLVVVADRTSNGPHLVYPSTTAPGASPDSENRVFDNFGRDPVTGRGLAAVLEVAGVWTEAPACPAPEPDGGLEA